MIYVQGFIVFTSQKNFGSNTFSFIAGGEPQGTNLKRKAIVIWRQDLNKAQLNLM